MLKVWFSSHKSIKGSQDGFSIVEVILAASIFAFLATALVGALVYGNSSTAKAGDRARAALLADEGVQAVRNIRDANYSNLVDGTYGLVQSGGAWVLSGSSDTSGIYTRRITIATSGTNRKAVTSTVSWQDAVGANRQVSVTSGLTNWTAAVKSWLGAIRAGSYDAASTQDGLKVSATGNYAYVVRNGGTPSFLIINISNPAAPTLAGSLTLAASPTNIFVSGNYAYVTTSSDTAELQIVNITNPAAPTLASSYNAAGVANGQSVYVNGNYAYLVRGANSGSSEFVILNITTPTAPTLVGSYGNNVSMLDVAVKGSYAYIGTSTGVVLIVNITTPTSPTLAISQLQTTAGTINVIEIFNNTLLLGQPNNLSVLSIASPTAPLRVGTLAITGTILDMDVDTTNQYVFLGTNNTTAELQIANISTLANPTLLKTVDISGTASSLNGVAYNAVLDTVVGASAFDTQEVITFIKN